MISRKLTQSNLKRLYTLSHFTTYTYTKPISNTNFTNPSKFSNLLTINPTNAGDRLEKNHWRKKPKFQILSPDFDYTKKIAAPPLFVSRSQSFLPESYLGFLLQRPLGVRSFDFVKSSTAARELMAAIVARVLLWSSIGGELMFVDDAIDGMERERIRSRVSDWGR